MSEQIDKPLMQSVAFVNDYKSEIQLSNDKLVYKYLYTKEQSYEIKTNDIICISNSNTFSHNNNIINFCKSSTKQASTDDIKLFVYSVIRHLKWEGQWNILLTVIVFSCDEQCVKLKARINDIISKNLQRPKSLSVFINPIGGFKKGVKLYYEKVEPLFRLAGIHTDVTVTQHRDEAKEKLLSSDAASTDGVVCVGGDGMLMEIVTGLLLKTRRQNQIPDEEHGPGSPEFETPVKVGIIPAGSTDTVAHSVMGTKDVVTAALHIITGSEIKLDTLAVYNDEKFIRYNVSLLGFGFYGNIISESESHRWMGPKRYDWLGVKNFVNMRAFRAEIKYLPADASFGHPSDGVICRESCPQCSSVEETSNSKVPETSQWVTQCDLFVAVNSFLLSCRCKKSPAGACPHAHRGNGCIDLVMVRQCTRLQFLHHLITTATAASGRPGSPIRDHFEQFNFVQAVRVKEFKFRLLESEEPSNQQVHWHRSLSNVLWSRRQSQEVRIDELAGSSSAVVNENWLLSRAELLVEKGEPESTANGSRMNYTWNCDGEPLCCPTVHCKTHRQVIRLFARGIPNSNNVVIPTGSGRKPASVVPQIITPTEAETRL